MAICGGIVLYTVAYSTLSIANYRSGRTLFDLAAFEQSFWSAVRGGLFLCSLEVIRPDLVAQMSHFGRHFSPVFVLLLPIFLFHQHPSTLLVLQSLALASAAVPLYLFARQRLRSPIAAALIALVYLANPAIHDVNLVNEFHELSFVTPFVFLALYALEVERTWLYGVALLGMLAVREDVALTVCALGIYVALIRRRRHLGLMTFAAGAIWFLVVVGLVIPALRGPNGPTPYLGYDYLGQGLAGIVHGIVGKPELLWQVVTSPAKLQYLYWLLLPVAFIALLAPDVLFVALPAMLIILASTSPLIYAMFAHYVAPVVPIVFIAAVVAIGRIQRLLERVSSMRLLNGACTGLMLLAVIAGTADSQARLRKYPAHVVTRSVPDPVSAAGISLAQAIPQGASLVVEDHRWLAHAANRRLLYFLFERSPAADYVLINPPGFQPITNVYPGDRTAALQKIITSGDYLAFQCSEGFSLYARKGAYARDRPTLACTPLTLRVGPN